MTVGWRILEYLPKSDKYKEWNARKSLLGYYIPNAEPRRIPEGASIHESLFERIKAVPRYRPVNLPSSHQTIPMPSAVSEHG